MAARFYDLEMKSRLREKRRLSVFLDELIKAHRPEIKRLSLTYLFRSDEAVLEVNRDFLQHDAYTDIITFDLSESATALEAEIHISTERVTDNAARFKTDYQTELHRVIFHGALHLAGLKDKKKADAEKMREAENAALEAYFQKNNTP